MAKSMTCSKQYCILILLFTLLSIGQLVQNVEGFICFDKIPSCKNNDDCWKTCANLHPGGQGACETDTRLCRCYWNCREYSTATMPQLRAKVPDVDGPAVVPPPTTTF
ncbi:hypothetical protein Dimus_025420 [Dionaea muscipula]